MRTTRILFDPDPSGGGGGTPDFRTQIPEEFRNEPSLQTINDLPTLVKGYVHAQRLVGQDRVAIPKQDAPAEEWNNFYQKLGRPESPDKYEFTDLKLPQGLEIDEQVLGQTRGVFHKLGLTPQQAQGVLSHYAEATSSRYGAFTKQQEASQEEAANKLRGEWGDKFDTNIEGAKKALAQFGGEEVVNILNETGLGNNPAVIKMLHKISLGMREDVSGRGGQGGGAQMSQQDAAMEIVRLKSGDDAEFNRYLNGDKTLGAVKFQELADKWKKLHSIAYPGMQTG